MIKVYLLVCPESGLVRYVGITKNDPSKRLRQHLSDRSPCYRTYWVRSLLKKDLIPEIFVIDEVSKDSWEFWERHYISLYRSWGFSLTNGTEGGIGSKGLKHSRKSKNVISHGLKGIRRSDAFKLNLSLLKKGKPINRVNYYHSEETKQKIGRSNKGKKLKRISIPVLQYDLQENFIKEWPSADEAAKALNVKANTIREAIRIKNRTSCGFIWKKKD